jgi:WD40 repeat protein
MCPGEHPFGALMNCLANSAGQETIEALLYQGTEGLVQWLRTRSEPMVVLVIDQFEELFTLCSDEVRQDFLNVVLEALEYTSDRFKLVIALRADFVAAGLEVRELAAILQRSSVLMPPSLSDEEYYQVIVRPAEAVGLLIEPELVEILLEDLDRTPADLPMLEFVLEQLWQQGALTLAAYRAEVGDLHSALDYKAQSAYDALDPDQQQCARWIFLALIGSHETRRSVPKSDLTQQSQVLIDRTLQALSAAKLIRINSDNTIELIHEVLIRHWSTLGEWLNADRHRLQVQRPIEQSAIEWKKSNRSPDLLLQGMQLAEAEELYAKSHDQLSPATQAFIEASLKAYQGEQPALKHRLKQAHRQMIAIAALAVAAFGLGGLALWSQRNAQIREIQALSASSEALLNSNQQLESLSAATQAGRRLQQIDRPWNFLPADVKIGTIATLQQAITQTQEIARLKGHVRQVNDVCISSDGQTIATVSNDRLVKLWSRDGRLLKNLIGHTDRVLAVDFSSDNQRIATASADKTIKLWNRDGTLLQTLTGHQNWVTDVRFSSDSRSLISSSRDGTIKLWQLDQMKEVQTFRGHKGWVNSISFGQNDREIISGGEDGTVKFWQVGAAAALRSFRADSNRVNSVMMAPNGRSILTSGGNVAKLWTLNGKEIATLKGHRERVNTASYSPDGRTIATGSDDRTLRLWDLKGTLLQTIQAHEAAVTQVRFSPAGSQLLSASEDKTARIWQPNPLPQLETGLSAMSVSPDGSIIAIAAPDNTIQLRSSDRVLILRGHTAPVTQVQISPDSSLLISASADKTIRLWNTSTGELLRTISGHRDRVTALSFNPDRQSFASASADKTIKIWAIEGNLLATLPGLTAEVTSLAFDVDGRLASGSIEGTVRLWNVDQQSSIVLGKQNGAIAALAFAPDGRTLASASRDNTIKQWSVSEATLRQTLSGQALIGQTLIGHQASVNSLSFNQDGSVLASGSDDTTIKLWNSKTGELLKTLQGVQDRVLSVAFQPGKLLSTSNRLGLTLWNLDLDSLLNQSCDRAQFYLRSQSQSCN